MTNKKTLEGTVEPVFVGDVQAPSEVRVNRSGGAVRAILKKIIMDKLGLEGDFLSAATVEIGPGKSVLLMGAADVVGHLQVNKSGQGAFEVVTEDSEDLRVDAVTEAFLALKTAQFEHYHHLSVGVWRGLFLVAADGSAAVAAIFSRAPHDYMDRLDELRSKHAPLTPATMRPAARRPPSRAAQSRADPRARGS